MLQKKCNRVLKSQQMVGGKQHKVQLIWIYDLTHAESGAPAHWTDGGGRSSGGREVRGLEGLWGGRETLSKQTNKHKNKKSLRTAS